MSRAINGEAARWGDTEHLLAAMVDLLAGANWQRAGDKRRPAPEPITRPGTGDAKAEARRLIETKLLARKNRAATP